MASRLIYVYLLIAALYLNIPGRCWSQHRRTCNEHKATKYLFIFVSSNCAHIVSHALRAEHKQRKITSTTASATEAKVTNMQWNICLTYGILCFFRLIFGEYFALLSSNRYKGLWLWQWRWWWQADSSCKCEHITGGGREQMHWPSKSGAHANAVYWGMQMNLIEIDVWQIASLCTLWTFCARSLIPGIHKRNIQPIHSLEFT